MQPMGPRAIEWMINPQTANLRPWPPCRSRVDSSCVDFRFDIQSGMAATKIPPLTRDYGLVASRISKLLVHVAEANGVPEWVMRSEEGLFAGVAEFMAPSGVIRWQDLAILADRVAAHFKSNEALEALGRSYYQHLEHLPYVRAASSILTLRGAFYCSNRFTAPHNYEALVCTVQWLNRGEALKVNRLKYSRDTMSGPVAYISKGVLEYFPTLFGREPLPFLEMELEERGCRFHIKLPPPLRPWFFMKRMARCLVPDRQRWKILRDQEEILRESQWESARQEKMANIALVRAREEERQLLARDLHDGLGQTLSGLSYRVAALRLTASENPDLAAIEGGIRSALTQARDLAHRALIAQEDEPLVRFKNTCATYSALADLPIHFAATADPATLGPGQVDELDFILREALANAVRHSGASHLQVSITVSLTEITLEIFDNGVGIPSESPDGFGISSMKARALALAATIEWLNLTPGTLIRCTLPILPT